MSPMVKLPLTIEHALLGFVHQRPMHAYEIHQTLMRAEALGLVWHLKQSLVYVYLERLEEEGYLTSTLEPQRSRPPRKVLALTEAGRAAYSQWLASPVEHGRDFRIEFLAKLFFACQSDSATAESLVARQQEACRAWLVELQVFDGAPAYDWLVIKFRIGQIEAILSWLDICAGRLSSLLVAG